MVHFRPETDVRRKQPAKLTAIAAAALAVFTRDGFASAQVADIAREAGLSVGALYLYVDSKQALFELALRAAAPGANVGRDVDLATLPLRARGMDATTALLEDTIRRRARWPVLRAALRASAPPDVSAEIAAIVGELFDILSRERPMIWLLDRCAWELPRLRQVYVERVRGTYFADLARYVRRRRQSRRGSRDERIAAIVRAIVEMVAWMAMHRAREPVAQPFDRAAARSACIVIARGGLLGAAAGWSYNKGRAAADTRPGGGMSGPRMRRPPQPRLRRRWRRHDARS